MCLENILYHLAKRYRREFVEGKRSFFQRIVQKDEGPGSHFVGFVSGINRMSSHTEVMISDGYYSIRSQQIRRANDLQGNDDRILNLIEDKKIYPGMKLHFINQSLSALPQDKD